MNTKINEKNIFDVAIIGAGPVGMMATYYCGTRGLKPILIDIQDKLGGQCSTLYPEKMIYDVASQHGCTGSELIAQLLKQLNNVEYNISLNTSIVKIQKTLSDNQEDIWELSSSEGEKIKTRTIIITIGKGAFEPRKLGVKGEESKGIFYTVKNLEEFFSHKVLIVGGGDSAFDWCLALSGKTKTLTQIHRTDQFRAHGISVKEVHSLAEKKKLELLPFYEVKEFLHDSNKQVEKAVIFNNKTKEERTIDVNKVIISAGFLTNLGHIDSWGLNIENQKIMVDPTKGFATNLPGVFSIGDIAHFEGKAELITTGFGEAATSAFYVYKYIHGNVKGAAWCAKLPK